MPVVTEDLVAKLDPSALNSWEESNVRAREGSGALWGGCWLSRCKMYQGWSKEQGEEGWEAAVGWSAEGPSEMPLPGSLPGRTAGISSLGPGQVLTHSGFL